MAEKQKEKKKAAPKKKKVEPEEDGGNNMGLSSAEMQEWLDVQEKLVDMGYGPEDIERELLKKHPQAGKQAGERSGAGLMASARTAWNAEIRLKHVVYGVIAIVGFLGMMKIIGMAFDVDIPLLHTASDTGADMDI